MEIEVEEKGEKEVDSMDFDDVINDFFNNNYAFFSTLFGINKQKIVWIKSHKNVVAVMEKFVSIPFFSLVVKCG